MFFDLESQTKKDKQMLLAFVLTPPPSKDIPAPIDPFELKLTPKQYTLMSDDELYSLAGTVLIVDTECYVNCFIVAFKSIVNGKVFIMETIDVPKLKWIFESFCTVGFNSNQYDLLLIRLALAGYPPSIMKEASDQIILWDARSFDLAKNSYNLPDFRINHIDLIEVAPLKGSLKLYGGRMHCQRMQDLPFSPESVLTPEQIKTVVDYCVNDLDITEMLCKELAPRLELRFNMSQQYQVDLRSKSNAQLAEAVIAAELTRLDGAAPKRPSIAAGTVYRYKVPSWLRFTHPALQDALETIRAAEFMVNATGSIDLPEAIGKLKLSVGNCQYRMGIGGLHSSEKSVCHIADANTKLIDRDVVSYYPAIIINEYLKPKHLGKSFMTVYKSIVDRRIKAKAEGDKKTAESLKICVNGSFGKLGNKWSILYAPDLLIQVTITGQLALLMLINMLEEMEIPVLSANTDGILVKLDVKWKSLTFAATVMDWEVATGFQTEESQYSAVYARDVNNYIAIKTDGEVKVKGTYSEVGSAENSALSKNPENNICNDAVIAFLSKGIAIEDTVNNCNDIRRFLTVRNVTGGAEKSGVYLGKCIRWYYSTQMLGEINYRKNGNKVPNSDGAMPIMELPDAMPTDLDRARYIRIAKEMLVDLGYCVSGATEETQVQTSPQIA